MGRFVWRVFARAVGGPCAKTAGERGIVCTAVLVVCISGRSVAAIDYDDIQKRCRLDIPTGVRYNAMSAPLLARPPTRKARVTAAHFRRPRQVGVRRRDETRRSSLLQRLRLELSGLHRSSTAAAHYAARAERISGLSDLSCLVYVLQVGEEVGHGSSLFCSVFPIPVHDAQSRLRQHQRCPPR